MMNHLIVMLHLKIIKRSSAQTQYIQRRPRD